ncbi:hypothetical protein [Microbacterium sp. PRC9]|uniref:hypothetical protein n=1 Tax=Microbacterium sp. PRC9 TaxID=2962591 RepID=UPI002881EFDA|nr:hypothetical protein [Microbacterium sp. PRC9]MDT0143221.1 hypothetical protein [Microbacterium sp. PRC9]
MPAGDAFRRPQVDPTEKRTGDHRQREFVRQPWLTRDGFTEYDEAFLRCYPAARRRAMSQLLDTLSVPQDDAILEGEAAFTYMVTLRESMVAAATEVAAAYHSTSWLHLIRRLNPIALAFAESGVTEYKSDETERVAENLVGNAQGAVLDLASGPVSTDVSMKLARLLALAAMVDSLEGAIRSATKGVKYHVRRNHRPRPFDSDALRNALDEFDLRGRWNNAEKTPRLDGGSGDDFDGDPPMLAAYRFHHGLAPDQVWQGPFRAAKPATEPVQFTIRAFTTGDETYAVLGRDGVLATFDDPGLAASLIVFGNALLHHVLDGESEAGTSLPHLGTLWRTSHLLLADISDALHRPAVRDWLAENGQALLTAASVLDNIRGLYEHGRRSLPGPVIHELGEDTLIDVWAYTWHVTDGLKISPHTGGVVANLSAEQFELAAQALIDSSKFAPTPALRELRGRTLRLDGRAITDVDAILLASNKVFLVSCKKFVIRLDYLAGEYTAARNARQRLEAALDEWRERLEVLRRAPRGDNYNLEGYEIDGFIVLPQLVFTPRSDSRELLRFGDPKLFFTRVESFDQFAATLEMAGWD